MTLIAKNKRARFDFHIEKEYEAGISLLGWEVKSLREKRADLTGAHIYIRKGEAFLVGLLITPLSTASTHIYTDPSRTKKLLLHKKEITDISALIEQKGFSCVPLNLYYKSGNVKCAVGIAKGKKQYDKRKDLKEAEWKREQGRLIKHRNTRL